MRFLLLRITSHYLQTLLQKDRISEAEKTYNTYIWSLDDLKDINKHDSRVYELVIETGISDDLAKGFKKDLKIFKP